MDSEPLAWREVIFRVFDGFEAQRDVSPDWLVNPDTGRALKLNYFYPVIGVAVRLEGLRGRQQRLRPDEFEQRQLNEREQAREKLCEEHGVRLLRFNVYDDIPGIMDAIRSTLAWALRQAAKAELAGPDKLALVELLRQARARFDEMRAAVRSPNDLNTWAELWVDRAYRETRADPRPTARGPVPRYALNMHVHHPELGAGRVIGLTDEDGDQIVTVHFDSGQDRQFLAEFVVDKLRPV